MILFENLNNLPPAWRLVPFGDIARTQSCDSNLIKGKLPKEPNEGLFPAYSASGQDVWTPEARHEGDAIIVSAVGARCGKCFRASGTWSAIANTHIVWPNPDMVDADFLWRVVNDEKFWIRGQSAQPYVQVSATKTRLIPLPPLAEQKKIAHILSTVQRAIEAQEQIIQTATELFKAMLHRLMTAQIAVPGRDGVGKYTGKSRDWSSPVDDYTFPPGWSVSAISGIADFARGVSWRKSEEAPVGEGILVVSIPNIKGGWIDYESKFNHHLAKEVTDAKCLHVGDIVFVGSSGSVHNVGRNAQVASLPSKKVAFASFVFKAIPKCEVVDADFLYYLLNSAMAPYPAFCKRAADGKFNFQLRDFASRLRVPLPPLLEQKKIAKILATGREKIDTARAKKTKLQDIFSALLHDLMQAKLRVGSLAVNTTETS